MKQSIKVLPIFKSNYSIGRSILTLDKEDRVPNYPVSIFSIAKDLGLKEVVVIDDSFSGAIEAYQNAAAKKIKMIFGVTLFVSDTLDKENESFKKKRSKINVLANNQEGYKALMKLWTFASKTGTILGRPHIQYESLKKMLTKNLTLLIPFYDSFLDCNFFKNGACTPDFSVKPIFVIEEDEKPTGHMLKKVVEDYCSHNGFETLPAKTILYEKREDFLAYLSFRCIHNRSSIQKPDLDGMSDDSHCAEAWEVLD